MKVTELVTQFAKPIVEEHGCSLWDVEYVREGSERFLRLYIDKDGGVDITDCEAISRAVDPVLDEKDPIAESYHFEVCSAGLERALKRPGDFARFMDSPIMIKLYRPRTYSTSHSVQPCSRTIGSANWATISVTFIKSPLFQKKRGV